MTRREAEKRIRSHLRKHAPRLVSMLTVAWGNIAPNLRAGALALFDVVHGSEIGSNDSALIVFDIKSWRQRTAAERRDLVDHETAHLIADWEIHCESVDHHGPRWEAWYQTLVSLPGKTRG